MKPIAVHAFNPGPMTGAGNWTWLIPGRVPTLIDAGTGEPRHLDASSDALDGARAGAGARDARACRSCVGRRRRSPSGFPGRRFLQDAVARARRDGRSRGSRSATDRSSSAGDDTLRCRSHARTRAGSSVLLARGVADAVLRRSGVEGHDGVDPAESAGRPG